MKLSAHSRIVLFIGVYIMVFFISIVFPVGTHAQTFQQNTTATLVGLRYCSGAWGDYDNDGDLDLLLAGDSIGSVLTSRVYRNDGGGNFTDINAGLTGVYFSSVAWGDYDNDGDLDILLIGFAGAGGRISRVYRNDNGVFTDINAGLTGINTGKGVWGDYDNDGYLDILFVGFNGDGGVSHVYRNNGGNSFSLITTGLPQLLHSSAAWGDYDNDGDLDIALVGYDNNNAVSVIYRNDGGSFTDINAGLPGVMRSAIAWGDYDNDGDLDILLSGDNDGSQITRIYRNDNGVFTDINAGLTGLYFSSVMWGDYDNDGDLDILLSGIDVNHVYRNDGGSFTNINAGLPSIAARLSIWGDYDNDGDLDILLAGDDNGTLTTQIWTNTTTTANTVPASPTGLVTSAISLTSATLSWNRASDAQTPQLGLSYNVRIGTTATGVGVQSPMSNVTTGYRRIVAMGNKQQTTSTVIQGILPGITYYWSVQAIDAAYAGSVFATSASFHIPAAPQLSTSQTVISMLEDIPQILTVSVVDIDDPFSQLVVTATSSNQSLIPNSAIVQQGATGATTRFILTPTTNVSGGPLSLTVRVTDSGGLSASTMLTITIIPVNDAPSFSTGANRTVLEDAGPQTTANWATSISTGPADESGQTRFFTVSNNNNSLFSVQPAVSSTGTLTFTPATNANGVAVVSLFLTDNGGTANGGVETSATQTFTIVVHSINDIPTFSTGGNVTINEDNGAYNTAFATGIDDGDPETTQTVSFVMSNNNTGLFSVQPSIDATTGVLSFVPSTDANGIAVVSVHLFDDGGTVNGGANTSATQTFTIVVHSINDMPTFSTGGNVVINEDNGTYNTAFATGIDDGDPEVTQSLTFVVSNDNPALFDVQPLVHTNGYLSFLPSANKHGEALVTVYLQDDGGVANGGVNTSATQTFTIVVRSVNDVPVFSTGANVVVNEDSGLYSAVFAAGIDDGDPETTQTLVFSISNSNPALFTVQPVISTSGVLTFTPEADGHGTAIVSVFLSDDGGVANGGISTSATQIFTITVRSVNDAPIFTTGTNVSVNEDSGAYSAVFATGIDDGDPETTQTVSFVMSNNNNGLFSVQPSIDASTGILTFVPAANANGTAVVSAYLFDDGGTASGGVDTSATQTFVITINSVNDAPSFVTGANIFVLDEDDAQTQTNYLTAISAGPVDEISQMIQFIVSNDNTALFSVQPSISSSGTLTFTPAHWAQGTAVVSVYAQDNGGTANGGSNTSGTQNFTISVGLSPVTYLSVASLTPVPARSGETVTVVVQSRTALGTLRATTGTTTLELQHDNTYLPVLSGSTEATLAAGASTATISVAFFSSSTANITLPVTVRDLSGVLTSTSSSMTIQHAVPSIPTATTNNAQVSLAWLAPVADNVTGYVVFRGTSASTVVEIATSATTSYVDNTAVNGTTYFYAVKSASGSLRSGISGTVEVTVPLLVVTSPNGGEMWQVGSTHAITWNTVGTVATVAVQYSLNNGGSWLTLSGSTTNTGSYSCFIQNPGSTEALVRVYDVARPLVMDMSNSVFTIVPIAPVTGLTVSALVNGAQLQWHLSTSAGISSYEIYHGLTSGTLSLLTTVSSSTGSYTHSGLDDGLSHFYALRTVVNGERSAYSQEVTVVPNTMKVLYANGGEEFEPGTEEMLRWQYSGDISSMIIEYSTDNGSNWSAISQTVTLSGNKPLTVFTQEWTVVNVPTTTALIRVRSLSPIMMSDESDATFTISRLAPPSNVVAVAGSTTITVSWTTSTSANVTGYRILRGTTSGNLTTLTGVGVVTSYVDTGATICTEYYYAVQTLVNVAASESSNVTRATVMLPESVTVVSPNGGESWQAGVTRSITWSSTGCTVPSMVTLSYSVNNGSSWSTIATVINSGVYTWLVPSTPTTQALVRVSSGILNDNSNAVFSIRAIPSASSLVAVAGNGSVQLSWTASSAEGLSGYRIYRGTTSGSLSLLASVASSATVYNDNSATNCTLYVYAVQAEVGAMTSAFSNEATATPQIPANLVVLSPNGGERWQVGVSRSITWVSTGCTVPSTVVLEYSTNNGGSWSTIATVSNTGLYSWMVPNTPSEMALVRISGGSLNDVSNGVFAISGISAPSSLAASAGDGSVGLSWSLSTAAGVTAQSVWRGTTSGSLSLLATLSSTATSYTDNSVTNCTLYIYAVTATVGGMNSAFSNEAAASPQIPASVVLVSPNGGEVWHGGQSRTITWTSTGCTVAANVTLSYSINNGSSWSTIATVSNTGSYSWTVPNTPSSQALVRVTGGVLSDNSNAVFTILATPVPVVTAVQPLVTTSYCAGSPSSVMVSVTLSDPIYPVSTLTVTAASSNQSVVANANIVRQGTTSATTTFMVTPSAVSSGVAQLTISASNGYANASTTISVSVTVNPLPVAVVSGASSVCASTVRSYSVTPTTGATYRWTVSGGSVMSGQGSNSVQVNWSNSSSGSVSVIVTSASLCTSSGSMAVSINANPVVSVTPSGSTTFCPGGSVLLTASPSATGYVWSNGATTQSIVVSTSGSYSVVVSNGFGCSTLSTSVSVTVHPGVIVDAGADVTTCSGSAVQLSAIGFSPVGGLTFSWSPATGLNNPLISNPQASPTTTTTYTVVVTDANGCSSSDVLTVFVRPSVPTTISSNAAICIGGSTQLEATGGVSYVWSPSTGLSSTTTSVVTASPTTTTTYTVQIQSAGGCVLQRSVTVTVESQPVASAGSSVSVCAGGSTQLAATGGVSYSWSPSTGLSNPMIANPVASPMTTTTYTVTVSNAGGCSSSSSVTVTVNPVVLNVQVLLEGPYNGASMSTGLDAQGLVPVNQPYTGAPFNYAGTETKTVTSGTAVVDWVLVDLRSGTASSSLVERHAGLLLSDGRIVSGNGSGLSYSSLTPGGSYYVVVWHRNHLSVMSSVSASVNSMCELPYTFTSSPAAAYMQFADGQKQLGTGVYGMAAGDANANGIINAVDRVMVRNASGATGYRTEDVSLDGIVNAVDRVITRNNSFLVTQVP